MPNIIGWDFGEQKNKNPNFLNRKRDTCFNLSHVFSHETWLIRWIFPGSHTYVNKLFFLWRTHNFAKERALLVSSGSQNHSPTCVGTIISPSSNVPSLNPEWSPSLTFRSSVVWNFHHRKQVIKRTRFQGTFTCRLLIDILPIKVFLFDNTDYKVYNHESNIRIATNSDISIS